MKRLSKLQVSMISMLTLACLTLASCGSSIGGGQNLPGLTIFGSDQPILHFSSESHAGTLHEDENKLLKPEDLAFDTNGKIYIADQQGNNIKIYNLSNNSPEHEANINNFELFGPTGLAIDTENNLYASNGGTTVKSFSAVGGEVSMITVSKTLIESTGTKITGMDHKENFLYMADEGNNRIIIATTPELTITEVISSTVEATITNPSAVAIDPSGVIMAIANSGQDNIVVYNKSEDGVTWVHEKNIELGKGSEPKGIAIDRNFNIFASLTGFQQVRAYRFDIINGEWNDNNSAGFTTAFTPETGEGVPVKIAMPKNSNEEKIVITDTKNSEEKALLFTYELAEPGQISDTEE